MHKEGVGDVRGGEGLVFSDTRVYECCGAMHRMQRAIRQVRNISGDAPNKSAITRKYGRRWCEVPDAKRKAVGRRWCAFYFFLALIPLILYY